MHLKPPFPRGVSGNPSGRPKHRLKGLAREEAGRGVSLVQFWGKLFRGEPIMRKVIRLLPPTTKKGAQRDKPYVVVEVPYYPTIEDMKWASERLAERGWGRPKRDVVADDGEIPGPCLRARSAPSAAGWGLTWPIGRSHLLAPIRPSSPRS